MKFQSCQHYLGNFNSISVSISGKVEKVEAYANYGFLIKGNVHMKIGLFAPSAEEKTVLSY